MRLLITADLHLNDNSRDEYRHVFMEKTLPALIRKHKVDGLLVLGDCTDEKDHHSAALTNRIVAELQDLGCPIVLLRGNHDYTDPAVPFFSFTQYIPLLTWINKPTRGCDINIKVGGRPLLSADHWFLPHTRTPARDWKDMEVPERQVVFTHQTFMGAQVGKRKLEGVPTDLLLGANIISGDVHAPQDFYGDGGETEDETWVCYVGAPYLCDFGDDYEPRVLLMEGSQFTSIPVPGVQKRLAEIKSLGELQRMKYNVGDILKVRIALTPADHARWPEIQSKVRQWGEERGYQIYLVQPVMQAGKTTTAGREATARSDQELLAAYGKARGVNAQTQKVGRTLMEKK